MPGEYLLRCATNTYMNARAFVGTYKSALSDLEGLQEARAAELGDVIDDMVARQMNPITLFVIAHGSGSGVRIGGDWFTAQQLREKLSAHGATDFNLLLGSSHSGGFINDLGSLDNVRVILTAASADQYATPDWDVARGQTDINPEDSGTEWSGSLLLAAAALAGSSAHWEEIEDLASREGVPRTSALLHVAGLAALGQYPALGLSQDLDLAHRVGVTTPEHYISW
jgi:hypothetical protein